MVFEQSFLDNLSKFRAKSEMRAGKIVQLQPSGNGQLVTLAAPPDAEAGTVGPQVFVSGDELAAAKTPRIGMYMVITDGGDFDFVIGSVFENQNDRSDLQVKGVSKKNAQQSSS